MSQKKAIIDIYFILIWYCFYSEMISMSKTELISNDMTVLYFSWSIQPISVAIASFFLNICFLSVDTISV